jgi:hypothetical protein
LTGIDIPGVNKKNYTKEKIHALIKGRIKDHTQLDQANWLDYLSKFQPHNMVNLVFFVIPLTALTNNEFKEEYSELARHFNSFKEFHIDGYHPYLIITKGDTIDSQMQDKRQVWDLDTLHKAKEAFIKGTPFNTSHTYFVVNYQGGNQFVRDPVIDYTVLKLASDALAEASSNMRRLYKSPEIQQLLEKKSATCTPTSATPSPAANTPVCCSSDCKFKGLAVKEKFCGGCGAPPSLLVPLVCRSSECSRFSQQISDPFCPGCGKKPQPEEQVVCCTNSECLKNGQPISGNFCGNCGKAPQKKRICSNSGCPKAGQQVKDSFCPSCGKAPDN